jgi:hypothetical protein
MRCSCIISVICIKAPPPTLDTVAVREDSSLFVQGWIDADLAKLPSTLERL